ncbi:hypothetical protein CEXT_588701 [Caerostris extrusa]|uniref:Uncharacterized protein n=1 Tax=Caerostris extrusa TaxID=172846 RepID=A0AAV4TRU9_CAEEX|nr:hypothetical protein CEXT_588701 [Caerostris extrusa]
MCIEGRRVLKRDRLRGASVGHFLRHAGAIGRGKCGHGHAALRGQRGPLCERQPIPAGQETPLRRHAGHRGRGAKEEQKADVVVIHDTEYGECSHTCAFDVTPSNLI